MILEVRYLLENYSAPELSAYRNVFGILPSLLVMLYTGELQFQKNPSPCANGSLRLYAAQLSQWRN